MSDWISELNTWVYGVASAAAVGIVTLIRKINTNEKQITLLKQEIALREEYRKARDEAFNAQLSEIRDDVKQLTRTEHGN